MRLLSLCEHQSRQYDPLPVAVVKALAETRLVEPVGTLDGRLRLRSKSLVGVVRVGETTEAVELRVRPKLPVGRLLWLLGHASDPRGWRDDRGECFRHQ